MTNCLVSWFIKRVGYANVYIAGGGILGLSALSMSFYHDLGTLLMARCFQGVGSSFGTVSGLGMIGSYYEDDVARIKYMGKAMSGLALGVLVGPPFRYDCKCVCTPVTNCSEVRSWSKRLATDGRLSF